MRAASVYWIVLFGLVVFCITSCEKQNTDTENYDNDIKNYDNDIKNTPISSIKIFNDAYLADISFADDSVGYISGSVHEKYEAVIAKTTDGGNSWKEIPVSIDGKTTVRLENIYAKNRNEIYGSFSATHWEDGNGTCYSNDGGSTWTKINDIVWRELFYVTPQIGFMVNASGDILKTQDGGKIWNTVHEAYGAIKYPNFYLSKCFFTSEKIGYAFGGAVLMSFAGPHIVFGGILKTTDGGDTWFGLEAWNDSDYPVELVFTDDNTGYAFTFDNNIYQTTDGGDTWILFKSISDIGYETYAVKTKNNDIYISAFRKILKTTDKFESIKTIYNNDLRVGKAVQISDKSIFVFSIDDSSLIKIDL